MVLTDNDLKRELIKAFKGKLLIQLCPNGGWPNFDTLEIVSLKTETINEIEKLNVVFTYKCDEPSAYACFKGNDNQQMRTVLVKMDKGHIKEVLMEDD